MIARQRGEYPAARRYLDRAVAAQLKGWQPEHVEVMKMRMHREYVECFADPTRAARGLGEIVATLERTVGSDHPISAHAQFEQAIERLGVKGAGSVQFREALHSYAEFARERLAPADTAPILGRYAQLVAQRTPLKLE